MYCSSCGSQMTGSTCNVCGASVAAIGTADALTGLKLAGWWRRVGATFTDNVILFLPSTLVLSIFTATSGALLGVFAYMAIQGVYLVKLLTSARGQTIGNRAALTRVRDAVSGQAITTQQALKRWGFVAVYQLVVAFVAGNYAWELIVIVSAIDDLYPLFNARKQTWHDRFAGTIVVMA
jgi:uncharacterized RDD family membrane protein YckC